MPAERTRHRVPAHDSGAKDIEVGARGQGYRKMAAATAVDEFIRRPLMRHPAIASTGAPISASSGVMPSPGPLGAVIRPAARCGAPSAIRRVP